MPYAPGDAYSKTHKANTPKRDRQWRHVFDSAKESGRSDGKAIQMASGVVKKQVRRDRRKAASMSVIGDGLMDKQAVGVAGLASLGRAVGAGFRAPGVASRAAIGAGAGMLGGGLSAGKDDNTLGRVIGGGLLGAAGGAATSKVFRKSVAGGARNFAANKATVTGNAGKIPMPVGPTNMPGVGAPRSPAANASFMKDKAIAQSRANASAAAAKQRALPSGKAPYAGPKPSGRPQPGGPPQIWSPGASPNPTAYSSLSLGDIPGLGKNAFLRKKAAPAAGMLGMLRSPTARIAGGAAIGAGLGYATKQEGESGGGRALGGAMLGAAGGALSSKLIRGNLMRGLQGKPVHDPGRLHAAMKRSPAAAVDVPAAAAAAAKPTLGTRVGRAIHSVETLPSRAAKRMRSTRSDIAGARAGMSDKAIAARGQIKEKQREQGILNKALQPKTPVARRAGEAVRAVATAPARAVSGAASGGKRMGSEFMGGLMNRQPGVRMEPVVPQSFSDKVRARMGAPRKFEVTQQRSMDPNVGSPARASARLGSGEPDNIRYSAEALAAKRQQHRPNLLPGPSAPTPRALPERAALITPPNKPGAYPGRPIGPTI